MAITDATPMITPRAVSIARVRFRHNARRANRRPSSHAIAVYPETVATPNMADDPSKEGRKQGTQEGVG
jgi:hypothetical protein